MIATETKKLNQYDIVKVNGMVGYIIKREGVAYFWNRLSSMYTLSELPIIESFEEPTVAEKVDFLVQRCFSWGKVIQTHVIAEYVIVEFISRQNGEVSFHTFTNFRDDSRSYNSLDRALLGVIARKHDGINTRADSYFAKALGMEAHNE